MHQPGMNGWAKTHKLSNTKAENKFSAFVTLSMIKLICHTTFV